MEHLIRILKRAPVLMAALRAAREVGAPDWLINAGAIRDVVWDDLHGRPLTTPPRDVDLGYFDPEDLTPERDRAVEAELRALAPDLPWEAKNQAAVHLWYPRRFGVEVPPFRSTAEAVATFPETASCVGVRLLDDDELLIVAPHGLDDLLAGVCRHNPARVSREFYARRLAGRDWRERWPRLRFVGLSAAAPGEAEGMETPEESGAGYPEEQPSEVDDTPSRRDPEADPSGGDADRAPDNEDGTATGSEDD